MILSAEQLHENATLGEMIVSKLTSGHIQAPVRRLPPEVHLYSWGDAGDWLYLIQSGWVKSMTWSWGGKPCLLNIHGPSDIIGISGFLTSRRAETAVTKTVAEIRIIGRGQFDQATSDPIFREAWYKHLTTHMADQQEALTHFVTLDSEHRLAMTLLRLARNIGFRRGPSLQISCRMTHDELAQMVGTTRSRVGYFLKRFEARRIVERAGHYLIVHENRLIECLMAHV